MIVENIPPYRPNGVATATNGPRGSGATFDIDVAAMVAGGDDSAAVLAAFRAEANKTPRDRCRDQVMAEMHLSQSDLDALPLKEAQALNARIEEEAARRMQTAAPLESHSTQGAAQPDPLDQSVEPPSADTAISTLEALRLRGASSDFDGSAGAPG